MISKKKKDKVLMNMLKLCKASKENIKQFTWKKNKLKDFSRKHEEDRKREEQELLRKQHAKQMDIYSKMIAAQKKDKTLKGGIMKVIAVIMMQKAFKMTTTLTKNEKRDLPKKLT